MGRKQTVKSDIIQALIKKYPKHGTRTLARMAFQQNPLVYDSEEQARSLIKSARGEMGEKARKHSKFFKENGKPNKEYAIPKTWSKPKQIFKIPSGYKNIGFISDVQCPFHDENAIRTAVKHLQEKKIDCLFINGDFLDFFGLSNFEKDPRRRNFKAERDDCEELLRWLRSQFKCPIYYNLDANHEYRYERYMMIHAPMIYSTDMFQIEDLLKLNDIGIIPIRGYDHVMAGKLPIIHGHTIYRGQTSPVSPARTIYMKLKTTAIASHVHKVSQYTCVNLKEEVMSFWTTGCLMNLNVEYNQHGNDYTHGFARIEILNDKGDFRVNNHMIIKGVVH